MRKGVMIITMPIGGTFGASLLVFRILGCWFSPTWPPGHCEQLCSHLAGLRPQRSVQLWTHRPVHPEMDTSSI